MVIVKRKCVIYRPSLQVGNILEKDFLDFELRLCQHGGQVVSRGEKDSAITIVHCMSEKVAPF